jgi:two-component system sensor histidine kinase MprB
VKLRTRVALAGGAVVVGASALAGAVEYPAVDNELRGQLDASLVDMVRQAPDTISQIKEKLAATGKAAPTDEVVDPESISLPEGSGYLDIISDPHVGPRTSSPTSHRRTWPWPQVSQGPTTGTPRSAACATASTPRR